MATLGMDPAIGQTISQLSSAVSGLPESYAAGQRHLLAQQIADFNQRDKDRTYAMNQPLKAAQTRYHTAKAEETEGALAAAEVFPMLSRKLLIPVRGMQAGEPDRIAFNEDPAVMADVVSSLVRQGKNPNQVIEAFRSGVAAQMAAAPLKSTGLPSPTYQAFSGRIGKDFASTTTSTFGIPDRDTKLAEQIAAASGRITQQQQGAWERASLAATTSRENNAATIAAGNSRSAASIIAANERNAARLAAQNAKVNANGQKPPPLNIGIINEVEGTSAAGSDGLASRDVDALYDPASEGYDEAKRTAYKTLYAEKFYEAYRQKNPPDAAFAREAARSAVSTAISSGVIPTTTAATDTPAGAVVAPAATGTAAPPGSPAAAIVATAPGAAPAAPIASYSNPSSNMIDATDDQIAASLGMTRDDLRTLAAQQGMSTVEYAKAVNTPAQEVPVQPEEPVVRTPEETPNLAQSNISAADALVATTAPAPAPLPASPLDSPAAAGPASAFQPAVLDYDAMVAYNHHDRPPVMPVDKPQDVAGYNDLVGYNQQERPPEMPAEKVKPTKQNQEVGTEPVKKGGKVERLKTPEPTKLVQNAAVGPGGSRTTVKGDSLFSIARSEGTTIAALAKENGLNLNAVLKGGEVLKVPASAKPAPKAAEETPAAAVSGGEGSYKPGDPNFLSGTSRGFPMPQNLAYSKVDPQTAAMPSVEFNGKTWEEAMQPTMVDNSAAFFAKGLGDKAYKPRELIGMPKEAVLDPKKYNPADYLYKPDNVTQFLDSNNIDKGTPYGKRVEELLREKFSLMNSLASSDKMSGDLAYQKELGGRIQHIDRKIASLSANKIARVSPTVALLQEDFLKAPGLIVNSFDGVKESDRKYVLKRSEVLHLLNTFTNVTVRPDGEFSVAYPTTMQKETIVTNNMPMPNRFYSTKAELEPGSKYIDGDTMFSAFDKAHPEIHKMFIRDGRLGMKPGDSLARTLVRLTILGNKEIEKTAISGNMGIDSPALLYRDINNPTK